MSPPPNHELRFQRIPVTWHAGGLNIEVSALFAGAENASFSIFFLDLFLLLAKGSKVMRNQQELLVSNAFARFPLFSNILFQTTPSLTISGLVLGERARTFSLPISLVGERAPTTADL